jgi:5-methylcytosine-specific restriction endonuclease McrA
MPTLLLNASYEPLRIISSQRAVMLILADKAEILEEGADAYHSATTSVPVPEVIKLKRFVQVPYRARIPLSNAAVLRRDNHECCYCLARKGTTVDHVLPRAKGGKHEWTNVVAACRPCNALKADKLLSDLQEEAARNGQAGLWDMRWQPYTPTGTMWLLLGLREQSPAWSPYLDAVTA